MAGLKLTSASFPKVLESPKMDKPNEAAAAVAANIAGYQARTEAAFIAGSPHLKYAKLRQLYDQLVQAAISGVARPEANLRVCDLGAGDGLASRPWLDRNVQLTAVDSSATMLERFARRPRVRSVQTVLADADSFAGTTERRFDIVCFVSTLHHVPDYMGLLEKSLRILEPGGAFLSFQDPLRFDRMQAFAHRADRGLYLSWRVTKGNLGRGLRTQWRRLRHVYLPSEAADFEEFHAVRSGVDSEAIAMRLRAEFREVSETRYWSNQAPWGQFLGARMGLKNTFAILATGKQ